MQSFASGETGTTTPDQFKPTREGIGLDLAAGINSELILGGQD
jgi:hypothetical protein